MANQLITTQLVSNTALAMFSNNAPFLMTASRMYQQDFTSAGYKIGSTLQVRRQNNFLVGDGPSATPQDIVETVEDITIAHQYHAMIAYTIQDLELKIDDFSRIFIQPAIQAIISQIELGLCSSAVYELNYFTGQAGTPINSFAAVDAAGTALLEQGVDISRDAYLALSLRDASTVKAGAMSYFTPMFNEEIIRQSAIGHMSYFDMFQSQNIIRHTAGNGPQLHPGDTLTLSANVSSGNVISISGATASVTDYFLPGDQISIEGVYTVNSISKNPNQTNMQFVIQQAVDSGSGSFDIVVSPEIITSGPQQNVSGTLLSGAEVTVQNSYNCNIAYTERSLDIVCPPLYKLQVPYIATATDPSTGLSLTVTQSGDINNYTNYMRIDVLCGFKWHPQYAVKVLS